MPRRFLLTGGGTGGHVTPALAAAGALAERYPDAQFRYVGLADKAEGVMAPQAGYPLSRVHSRGLPPPGPGLLCFAWHLGRGILAGLGILLRDRPSLIIATGGYVAAPLVLANALLRRLRLSRAPLLVHEQNSHLGRLNRVAAGVADLVAVSFPETLRELPNGKGVYVGYPVRASCARGDRDPARRALGIPRDALVVFAFGGSQGARSLNHAVADAAPALLGDDRLWLIHGCGRPFGKRPARDAYHGYRDVEARLRERDPALLEHPRYRRLDFIDGMADCYAASDLVVCRAGAGSLMEVCAQGRPAVVIPKANLPGDHQVRNARLLERAGACRVLYERIDPRDAGRHEPAVSGERLAALVTDLLDDGARRERMAAAAANLITTDARRLLGDCAVYLLGDGPRPAAATPPPFPDDRVMGLDASGMERLLQQVASEFAPPLDAAERELLLSKIDALLASRSWLDRARGCRVAGFAGYGDAAPALRRLAASDLPLVRRDALKGLRGLGPAALSADARLETLLGGLNDPYYEARVEAALTAAAGAGKLGAEARRQLTERLAQLCRDSSFEVRMAAVRALGRLADAPEPVMTALERVQFDPVWKVRGALFQAYAELADRQVISPTAAHAALDAVLITANGYLTDYEIRHRRNEALRRIRRREA
ncbi:MAG TPA: glycosyltransferase [Candidatus Krumholzibacteria bacterium]|nr:glycosyltransferase [Candidatus Krumholzibacteria bacterium]HPD72402.1 glycosyltransferase [Candidatus Krumholzibacteria bacterium]HRY40666.1 glycosyltransferase [Candidatus Krumholzibacteria bacterium]